ncbi:MICOS complex subunit MIC25 isoform X3 [Pantherophis guttatus]|uniref:MICOS complex subunit MIC25 isoform X3 n=1 Tax=Pantherophis guttatus TaxID=94885 RepID=A0A6P9CW12_PANGU|nr:MICOS complex subunit MIC25 isoform X3 [Pantherophis guttatus]
MGGSGSTHGSRKVSFELDEQEQVRVLQGIRLSEDVVNRMKEKSQPKQDQRSQEKSKVSTGICPPTTESLGQKPSEAKEELYKRYEQEQAMVQEELLRLAKREKEAVSESLGAALQQERICAREDKQKASHLNSEIYKLTLDQYNEAVTNAEDQIRKRNTQPICANLQEAIMECYNENKQQVLNCSELVKEYQRCVRLAQKELLVHFD